MHIRPSMAGRGLSVCVTVTLTTGASRITQDTQNFLHLVRIASTLQRVLFSDVQVKVNLIQ